MRANRMATVALASWLLLVVGCAQQNVDSHMEVAADATLAPTASSAPSGVSPGDMQSSVGTSSDPARRFVVTANVRFQVKDVYQTALSIEDAAAAEGGFTVSNEIRQQAGTERVQSMSGGRLLKISEYTPVAELVVRVPAARTQAFLRGLASRMEFMDQRDLRAVDVQFDELRQRMAAQRASQTQAKVDDAATGDDAKPGDKLDAARAGHRLAMSADEAELRRRELEDRVAFSTITLNFYQPPQLRQQTLPDTQTAMRDAGPGFWPRIGQALGSGWRGLLEVLVVIAHAWPLWLVIAVALVLARRVSWRRRRGAPEASNEGR